MPPIIGEEFQAAARWKRDSGIVELIEYFDQEKFLSRGDRGVLINYDAISSSDWGLIEKEVLACRKDFFYASKNYFWITNKQTGDQLFSLWESQEMILEEIMRIRAMGLPQKLIVLKARQLGALDPNTKVLTASMDWKRIDDLRVGEEVLSVDEMPTGGQGSGRKFRTAKILRKWHVDKEAYRITLDNGTTITATGDHPFLCRKRGGVDTVWVKVNDKDAHKKSRSPIRPGDEIRFIAKPWDNCPMYEDGWFSGLLDGEGSLRNKDNGGVELSVSQVAGYVLERAKRYLGSRGYHYRIEVDKRKAGSSSKLGNKPVYKLVLHRMPEIFKLLGRLRPSRFSDQRPWEGKKLPKNEEAAWAKVVSIEPVGVRTMVDIETTTKTFIAEGLVTHNCSTLIEGLIAWETMFNPNINALVVGPDDNRSEYLFSIMLHIYDQMPWWLKPMCANREFDGGLLFHNPIPDERRLRPGLNSRIEVQKATQYSGIGQGIRLTCAHVSEISDWSQKTARQTIDGDLGPALAESPMTFAIIESTAKGAGTYYNDLWRTNKESGKDADWYTIFLPWFFEKTRVLAPEGGWHPQKPESSLREQVKETWCACDSCARWMEMYEEGVSIAGSKCAKCQHGYFRPYILSDEQLRFIQRKRVNAEKKGAESVKELKQELSSTDVEAFQISGDPVFPADTLDFAEKCVRPPILEGYLDAKGNIHAVVKIVRDSEGRPFKSECYQDWCEEDHRFDEKPLRVWELPMEGHEYTLGIDVAEGLGGRHDYSVISILRVGKGLNADAQVAVWRSNEINHYDLSTPVVQLGRMYNYGMVCIEYNTYQTCADEVRIRHNYPTLYRWKHLDSQNIMSTKWHWITQSNSKPKLWGSGVRRLRGQVFYPRSANLVAEMKTFQKDEDSDKSAGAERGFHDDELMATLIALHCSHEIDQAPQDGALDNGRGAQENKECDFQLECLRCHNKYESNNRNEPCTKCRYLIVKAKRRGQSVTAVTRIDTDELWGKKAEAPEPTYDSL